MGKTSRFTVSLPAELLREADERLIRDDEGRSALIRRLLEDALRQAREQEDVERFIKGYEKDPQSEEEFGWSEEALREQLTDLPWK